MTEKKMIPAEVTKFFSDLGKEYGHLGGKKAAENMTKREKTARALKAVRAREAKRKAKEGK